MKKGIAVSVILLVLLCFSACVGQIQDDPTLPPATPTETASAPETTVVPNAAESALLPLPGETTVFSFLSGAGGWSTDLILNHDGSFTGFFHDSELGEMGEDYPNGTVYICSFWGKFTDVEQINDHAYKMHLPEVSTQNPEGEEWITNGVRYVTHIPYGLEEGTEFVLYLPDTPISEVPEESLIWWPYLYSQNEEPKETLSCYGILNTATNYGFFKTD